jgi:hypothetical protein
VSQAVIVYDLASMKPGHGLKADMRVRGNVHRFVRHERQRAKNGRGNTTVRRVDDP